MLAITIEDLKIYLNNLNIPLEKSAIWLELLVQKRKIE